MIAGMPDVLRADWQAPPGVVAFTTLRHGNGVSRAPFDDFNLGARCGDDVDAVARNRDALVARFGLPSSPRWLRQVHGAGVAHFDALAPPKAGGCWEVVESALESLREKPKSKALPLPNPPLQAGEGAQEPEADAAVTRTSGTVLAILTADCLPVLFASDDGSEVAAAHAGWRGLARGVLEATIGAMQAPPDRVVAWLGPAAGPQGYEVGEEVFDAFTRHHARAEDAFIATRPGHWRVDLYRLARMRLATAGVSRVEGGGLCTISDPQRFYSHRRDQRTGRMATIIYRT